MTAKQNTHRSKTNTLGVASVVRCVIAAYTHTKQECCCQRRHMEPERYKNNDKQGGRHEP